MENNFYVRASSRASATASAVANSHSIGFTGLLTVLFIGLKLTHYIDWSWWFVLAPLWAVPALILGIAVAGLIVVGIAFGIAAIIDLVSSRKR